MTKNIGIIPLRSGSQRFANKNIRKINGLPLFCIAGLVAKKSKVFDDIWIAYDKDDAEVREFCERFGFNFYLRSPESATREAPTEHVLIEFLRDKDIPDGDWVTVIQATCPFQNEKYFLDLNKIIMEAESSITSVITRVPFKRFFIGTVISPKFNRSRTQDIEPGYLETGLFWSTRVGSLLDGGSRITSNAGFVDIEPGDDSDIDDVGDYEKSYHRIKSIANSLLGYYKKRYPKKRFIAEYYREIQDPDGNIRNLALEEQGRLDFARDEIEYLKQYIEDWFGNKNNSQIKILDVGCGNGVIGNALKRKGVIVHGIEPSEVGASIACQKLDLVHQGPYETSPFIQSKDEYEVVMAFHVIEHLDDPIDFIKKCYAVLKNNGLLLVSTPDFEGPMAKIYGEKFRLLHDETHISLFGAIGLISALTDEGFSVIKFEQPFLNTKYCNAENIKKILDFQSISPPFTGNVMSIYAVKN